MVNNKKDFDSKIWIMKNCISRLTAADTHHEFSTPEELRTRKSVTSLSSLRMVFIKQQYAIDVFALQKRVHGRILSKAIG